MTGRVWFFRIKLDFLGFWAGAANLCGFSIELYCRLETVIVGEISVFVWNAEFCIVDVMVIGGGEVGETRPCIIRIGAFWISDLQYYSSYGYCCDSMIGYSVDW